MPLTEKDVFNITRETVIHSITNYAQSHLNDVRNFQILDLIIPTERKIRSIVGGLETSLGTTLWEPLAKSLARENGFEVVVDNLRMPKNMPANLHNTLQTNIAERRNGIINYNAKSSHQEIKNICQGFIQNPIESFKKAPSGHGVDVWLKRDGINYFFDTKTVQPNVADYSKYLTQLLTWYAYYYAQFPEGFAEARIVFPYNPYGNINFWHKTINKGKPLEPGTEAWVEDEFWDFCSGVAGSYQIIRNAFTSIAQEGDLEDILNEIFYN